MCGVGGVYSSRVKAHVWMEAWLCVRRVWGWEAQETVRGFLSSHFLPLSHRFSRPPALQQASTSSLTAVRGWGQGKTTSGTSEVDTCSLSNRALVPVPEAAAHPHSREGQERGREKLREARPLHLQPGLKVPALTTWSLGRLAAPGSAVKDIQSRDSCAHVGV